MMNDGFREIAFEIERNPSSIENHLDLPGVRWLSKSDGLTCRERVPILESLAYGDIGVLLASPGPSLSGYIIRDLGTPEQKEEYYAALNGRPTWTFFALSEPERGSDAAGITTTLTADGDGYRLNGEKYFIGNGARGMLGVVFAAREKRVGPLGIEIVFFRAPCAGFTPRVLPTLGLTGAGISHLKFDNVRVEKRDIVGSHLTPTKRGLWGAIQTFNQMRPGVAAMALGVAQATYDYIVENRRALNEGEKTRLRDFEYRLTTTRLCVAAAAAAADEDPTNGTLASVAKVRAVGLVEELTHAALGFFGKGSMLEHPYLNKWYRDARGFEYMEGTSIIHRHKVFQSYLGKKLKHA